MMEEELHSRQIPQSIESEQSVLGSILIDSGCLPEVIEILKPEDFYLQKNREIFEVIYSLFNLSKPVDPVTITEGMREQGYYDEKTYEYIEQLMRATPTAVHAGYYAGFVRDKAILRSLANAAAEITDSVYAGSGTMEEILEAAEKKIFALRKGERGNSLQHIGPIMHSVFDYLSEIAASDEPLPGLSTGLYDLDRKTNGLGNSDLFLIAARPAMGKSSLAMNIAVNVAKKYPKAVCVFNLEMSRQQLAMRLLSSESFVDNQKLATGKLDDEEWSKLAVGAASLSQTDIRIDDNPSITVAEMNAKLRRVDNLGLVVIDYLQLMNASGYGRASDNRVTAVGEISRSLKIMAKELNVPVICLSQLSRANESRTDKRPMLSDLRESGAIEQDADVVLFIYRDDYYNPNSEEKNVAELILAKNRHGETGTVKVQWLPEYTTFTNREWKHAE